MRDKKRGWGRLWTDLIRDAEHRKFRTFGRKGPKGVRVLRFDANGTLSSIEDELQQTTEICVIHNRFPNVYICPRLEDMPGGFAGARRIDPACVEALCSKCGKHVVISAGGRQFLNEHPQPIMCYPCAKRIGVTNGIEVARPRDERTGIPRSLYEKETRTV